MSGNIADVYIENGKYFAYFGNKKLCQSKRIIDIEMLLLVKRWTQKARDANITQLRFHFDEIEARNKEVPVTAKEEPSDRFLIERVGNTMTVTANDNADPLRPMIPKDVHEIRRRAFELNCLRRFIW